MGSKIGGCVIKNKQYLLQISKYNKQQLRMARKRNCVCHLCGQKKEEQARCSISRCSVSYCYDCIHSAFNQNFNPENFVPSCWICYSCTKSCKCNVCMGVLPNRKKNTTSKPKTITPAHHQQKPIEAIQNLPKTNKSQQPEPNKNVVVMQEDKKPQVKVQHILQEPSLVIEMQASKNCSANHKMSSLTSNSNNLTYAPPVYDHPLYSMFPAPYPPYNYVYFYF